MRLVVDIVKRRGGGIRYEVGLVFSAEPEPLLRAAPGNDFSRVHHLWLLGPMRAALKMVYCPVHVECRVRRIHPSALAQVQSPWYVGELTPPHMRMAVQDPTMKAAPSLARRYNSASAGEMIARDQQLTVSHSGTEKSHHVLRA